MAFIAYGETDWDEGSSKKTSYFKLNKDKENTLRAITKCFKYGIHQVKFPDDPNPKPSMAGWRIRCAGKDNDCILCKLAKAQKENKEIEIPAEIPAELFEPLEVKGFKGRWMIGILSKDENPHAVHTLDIGGGIRTRLKELNANKKWGDPRNYDITISVNEDAEPQNYYSVDGDPTGIGQLSEDDTKIVETFDIEALRQKVQPVTNKEIVDMIGLYRKSIDKIIAKAKEVAAAKEAAKKGKDVVDKKTSAKTKAVETEEFKSSDVDDDLTFKSSQET